MRNLTPVQAGAYRLADNQIATISIRDQTLLGVEMDALRRLDLNLGLLRFDSNEVAKLAGTGRMQLERNR